MLNILFRKSDVKIEEYWAKKSCGRKSLRCMFCEIPYGDCIEVLVGWFS